MIVNAWGVVLARRNLREADRLVTIYTENLGKLTARFVGVDKPGRKLKALSEPMVWGEYRLYLSPRTDMAKVIGGQIIGSFPQIRDDFKRTVTALACCEMLAQLTPERSPNEDKYRLICSALGALETGDPPWLETAFGLQLLELCGYGIRDLRLSTVTSPADLGVWERLHDTPMSSLAAIEHRPELAQRFRHLVHEHVEAHIGKALRTRDFSDQLRDSPLSRLQTAAAC